MQPVPHPSNSPCIKPVPLQCGENDVVWDCIKGLTEVKIDDISFSSLIHQCSRSIVECHQLSQARFAFCEAVLVVTDDSLCNCKCRGKDSLTSILYSSAALALQLEGCDVFV